MQYVLYFLIQFSLLSVLFLASYYLDEYISKPFTVTDLIATVIAIAIALVMSRFHGLKKKLKPMSRPGRVILSIIAVVLATLFIGMLTESIVFQ